MRNGMIGFILASLAILSFSWVAFAQTQDDLFNGDILHEIRIYIAPQDYVTFKETNFTCQSQELEALAGKVISSLPRVICHFPIEFRGSWTGFLKILTSAFEAGGQSHLSDCRTHRGNGPNGQPCAGCTVFVGSLAVHRSDRLIQRDRCRELYR